MKRSEMILILRESIANHIWARDRGEMILDDADKVLDDLETAGMVPPQTNLADCPEPALQIWSGDNIDIPHWIIHGWDNE